MPSKTTSWSRSVSGLPPGHSLISSNMYCYSSWQLDAQGQIRLDVSNAHTRKIARLIHFNFGRTTYPMYPLQGSHSSSDGPLGGKNSTLFTAAQTAMRNEAFSKFNGKVRKGASALGITVASWKQSRDMLQHRLGKVGRTIDLRTKRLEGNPRERRALQLDIKRDLRNGREPLANRILEVEFGWRPLFTDISKALSVAAQPIPQDYVKGVAKRNVTWTENDKSVIDSGFGHFRVTYGAVVSVTNPNAFLLNQLGLLNPIGVAWDLIPWSFVVNMFLNVNQMIESLTNEVGLTVRDRSITETRACQRERLVIADKNYGQYRVFGKEKIRTLVTRAPVSWQPRLPNFDWELAVIAASLVTQKFKKLNRLLSL